MNDVSSDKLYIPNIYPSNITKSPAQYKQGVFKDSKRSRGGDDKARLSESKPAMNANDGRNAVITKNETLYIAAQYISNTVFIMYLSVFISLVILRDRKWFYIILIVFVVNILATILKIFLMRFNYGFLHRPGKCVDENMDYDLLESNFILEGIKKTVNSDEYNIIGFPSMHTMKATMILALTYLFFPKYKKTTLIVAPIYLAILAWARIYLDCHTVLQILGGIILGVGVAKVSFNLCN
jgi:membrane-associated phospholipid phosphatase